MQAVWFYGSIIGNQPGYWVWTASLAVLFAGNLSPETPHLAFNCSMSHLAGAWSG